MPTLRTDPTTGAQVVISGDRGHRPIRLTTPNLASVAPADCPFCPGNEALTMPTLAEVKDGDAWRVRAFPNRFPALRVEEAAQVAHVGPYTEVGALGAHEVVALSPDHHARLHEDPAQLRRGLRVIRDRLADLRRDRRMRHLGWFWNDGALAGASQPHPHAQIVASAHVPWLVDVMAARALSHHNAAGRALMTELVQWELQDKGRLLQSNDDVVSFAAWAPRFLGEVWIVPARGGAAFDREPDAVVDATADALALVVRAIHGTLAPPALNVALYQAPADQERGFVWHLRVTPRRVALGGWELLSGGTMLPTAPEDVAAAMRATFRP